MYEKEEKKKEKNIQSTAFITIFKMNIYIQDLLSL